MEPIAETSSHRKWMQRVGFAPGIVRVDAGVVISALVAMAIGGCTGMQATRNGWLSPTHLGNFEESKTSEIRTSLTLEDTPSGILGATLPSPADLVVEPIEPRISEGDSLALEIFELRQPLVPYQAQVSVTATGYVNVPVVGRVYAVGLTPEGFERAIAKTLRDRNILVDPEVMVNPVFIQRATYSIFGIGVSAANNAPLRAGTFPIRRPGLRILEAINQVGGLSEFVEDIYVFRYEDAQAARTEPGGTGRRGEATQGDSADAVALDAPGLNATPLTPEEELIAVVVRPDEGLAIRQAAGIPPGTPGLGLTRSQTRKVEPASIDPTGKPARGPNDPYIWVGDEFVPNPDFRQSEEEANKPTTPQDRGFPPTVDWNRIAGDVLYRTLRIPAEMLRSGDPQVNVVIRPGDVIRIVSGEIGVYYVMGQVNRVGAFAFNAEPITLKAAIATAGGLAGLAWPSRCTVYRRLGRREQMIQVDLDRIFAGKDADFLVRRGDIINVGTHPFAPFLQRLRALTLPNPVADAGYSFRYSRSFNFTTSKIQVR